MKIDKLINESYNLFADYQLRGALSVCKDPSKIYSVGPNQELMLLKTPLQELTSDDLKIYLNSSRLYTKNEQMEMCYFLPRILELMVADTFPLDFEEQIFDKLFSLDGEFVGTSGQYIFLQSFLEEYIIYYLDGNIQRISINLLLAIADRYFNVNLLLDNWLIIPSFRSTLIFAYFIISNDKHLYNQSISATPNLNKKILSWLLQKKVYNHFSNLLVKYFFDSKTSDNDQLIIESALVMYQSLLKRNDTLEKK